MEIYDFTAGSGYYMSLDPQELGRFLYKKYFFKKGQIQKYYKEGQNIIRFSQSQARRYKNILFKQDSFENLQSAFGIFLKNFRIIFRLCIRQPLL